MEKVKISGIYTITNLVNGKIYLGYSVDCERRKSYHLTRLAKNIHDNQHLQLSYNKYGNKNFKFEILEEYSNEGFILSSMENYWANLLNVHNRDYGYNIQPTNPYEKRPKSPETLVKMSLNQKGKKRKPHTEETKKKMSLAQKGKIISKESREKLSKTITGRKLSPEHIEKVRLYRTGRKCPNCGLKGRKENKDITLKRTQNLRKPVVQYDLKMNFIKEWESIQSCKISGFCPSMICKVCKNKKENYKKYIWKYKEQ